MPEIVTPVPTGPFVGEKPLIAGAEVAVETLRLDELVAVPQGS